MLERNGVKEVKNTYNFPNDKATNEWLDAQKKSTRATYKTYWKFFLEFTGLTGDKIIDSRKADKNYTWEKKDIEFKQWMINTKHQSEKSGATAAAMVRGFFAYHRLTLQFRRQESAKLKEAQTKYEDYKFSIEDLKKMFDVADLNEKYVLTAGKSFGLRSGDLLRLTRGDFEPYIDRPVPISIGEMQTQKEKIKAYPFIDSDALPVIKLMIDKMNRQGRTDADERMLTYSDKIQLSRVLRRVADKAGVKYGNKRVRFHNLRKFLIDHLASYMSESKWKQIVGKQISEGAYVSPDSLREDYARAMSETTFTKPTFEGDIQKQIQKEALLAMAKTMGLSADSVKALFRKKRVKDVQGEIEVLEDLIGKKETQTNGGDCGEQFEQISESQLLSYLKAGWQIVKELQNGEVIVKR